jgi:hypothetical protein
MHTLDLLEEATAVAEQLGFRVRHEWLGGSGGGGCEFGGQRWIFIDLALNVHEQLDQIAAVLRNHAGIHAIGLSVPLTRLLGMRKAA